MHLWQVNAFKHMTVVVVFVGGNQQKSARAIALGLGFAINCNGLLVAMGMDSRSYDWVVATRFSALYQISR